MKISKFLSLLLFVVIISIPFENIAFGAFINTGSDFNDTYFFSGQDERGKTFSYEVNFELWREVDPLRPDFGLYQYRYQVANLVDPSLQDFVNIDITYFPNVVTGYGWDPGDNAPFRARFLADNEIRFGFPWIEPGDQSTWFWITSYGEPKMFPHVGGGTAGAGAMGNLPAPVPEPSTILLLGTGIVGFLYAGRRKRR